MRAPQSLQFVTIQNPTCNMKTRRHMVVIEDYDHMKTMDENVKQMKLTHLLSALSPNLTAPFCTSHVLKFYSLFGCTHQKRKKYLSLMYTMYASTSNNTLSYTHVSFASGMKNPPPGNLHTSTLLCVYEYHIQVTIRGQPQCVYYARCTTPH